MSILYRIKQLIPVSVLKRLRPHYHLFLAYAAALWYRFPSRSLTVIGVTGTKGKSTVTELVGALMEAGGHKVAIAGTIRFKIGEVVEPNLYKMTMPGRFFVQGFLRRAVNAGCDVVVLEMTSEGVLQSRHRCIDLDALIFTNLTPEHIESHGSFENYVAAKLQLKTLLEHSQKRPRKIIANSDDERGKLFLDAQVEEKIPYSLRDPRFYTETEKGTTIHIGSAIITSPLIGTFNIQNALAAISTARSFGVSYDAITRAFQSLPPISGRVEKISAPQELGKHITAVVDYAHTPDSLTKLYSAFKGKGLVCVLGNTGGGRDTWKRPEMGRIAGEYCRSIILTDEDPYDEDPRSIVESMKAGVADQSKVRIIMDRRKAIHAALTEANNGEVVLISGKGTDPYIMGPHGTKTPWSDARVVREELEKLSKKA